MTGDENVNKKQPSAGRVKSFAQDRLKRLQASLGKTGKRPNDNLSQPTDKTPGRGSSGIVSGFLKKMNVLVKTKKNDPKEAVTRTAMASATVAAKSEPSAGSSSSTTTKNEGHTQNVVQRGADRVRAEQPHLSRRRRREKNSKSKSIMAGAKLLQKSPEKFADVVFNGTHSTSQKRIVSSRPSIASASSTLSIASRVDGSSGKSADVVLDRRQTTSKRSNLKGRQSASLTARPSVNMTPTISPNTSKSITSSSLAEPTAIAITDLAKSSAVTSTTAAANEAMDMDLAMDWEPLDETHCSETLGSIGNASGQALLQVSSSSAPEILFPTPQPADWLNFIQAMLRPKQTKVERVYQLSKLHVVLDTNILLHHLRFAQSLLRIKISGTEGCIIYLPYKVIKELDNLNRTNNSASLRVRAQEAMKFLNDTFDTSKDAIISQTALEEKDHLIEVLCGDDSIMNCCIQLHMHCKNMILISNDRNLILKAKANAIDCASYADFSKTHRELFYALL